MFEARLTSVRIGLNHSLKKKARKIFDSNSSFSFPPGATAEEDRRGAQGPRHGCQPRVHVGGTDAAGACRWDDERVLSVIAMISSNC